MFHQYVNTANAELKKEHIQELYYIVHLDNLKSVLNNGILSHKRAGKLADAPTDISNSSVQDIRASKRLERVIPEKKPLVIHRHAVLYLNPHNAMMKNIIDDGEDVCILRVNKDILDRGDVVISRKNASVGEAEFFTANAYKLNSVDTTKLVRSNSSGYTNYYTKESDEQFKERIKIRQSEVLLPYEISPLYFIGIITKDSSDVGRVQEILKNINKELPIAITPSVFCKGNKPYLLENFPLVENTIEIQNHEYPDTSSSEDESNSQPMKLKRK